MILSRKQKEPAVVDHAIDPITQEEEAGESQSEVNPGKSSTPYVKNKLKAEELRVWLKR